MTEQGPDYTYSMHTGKPSRSSKKSSSVTDVVKKTDSNSNFIMSLVPIVISIGTVALVYLLYKELKKGQKTNYDISQTVKNCQAKIVELEKLSEGASDLTEILRAANGNVIFEGNGEDSDSDSDSEDRPNVVIESDEESVEIKNID